MKNYLLLIMGLAMVCQSHSQTKNTNYLQLNAGIVSEGIPGYSNIEFGVILSNKYVLKTGLWFEKSRVNTTESTSGLFMIDLLYRKQFGKLNIKGGAGLFGGMESLYSKRNEISVKSVVFGPKIMCELGYDFNERFGVALSFGEMFLFNSSYGSMYGFAGIGFNYKLNKLSK